MSVVSGATQGAYAFNQALKDSQAFVQQQMQRFGWMMPGAGGQYSTSAAGQAYDPNAVMSKDDQGMRVSSLPMGVGQYGTTGLFAQTQQGTAAEEAQARLAARMSGLGRGSGLSRQREIQSETAGAERIGDVSAEMFAGLMGSYGGVEQSYEQYLASLIGAGTGAAEESGSQTGVVGEPPAPEPDFAPVAPGPAAAPTGPQFSFGGQTFAQGDRIPSGPNGIGKFTRKGSKPSGAPDKPPAGTLHRGQGGVWFVYRPSGPNGVGWYRQS